MKSTREFKQALARLPNWLAMIFVDALYWRTHRRHKTYKYFRLVTPLLRELPKDERERIIEELRKAA